MFQIKALREAAGVSMADFAERVGVGKSAVCQWELGHKQPTADKLPLIARILGCTVDDLYKEEVKE